MDITIYKILLWALPVLLAILAFIGALGVKFLITLATDVNEIKVGIGKMSVEHSGLEKRVDSLEEKNKYQKNGKHIS